MGGSEVYTISMELYHVLNRGVDKREIFLDSQDYVRFVHNLYEFNDSKLIGGSRRESMSDIVSPTSRPARTRERLVDVHGWVLMKNHYHLLLSERIEGGMSLFLRKLNVGYAKYFNEKYERDGTLFQGRTKKVLIEHDAQFLYILHYIHLNPLDYLELAREWRVRHKGSIADFKTAMQYLDTYRWSSYLDYAGTKNFPSVLTTSLFKNKDVFTDYKQAVSSYLKEIEAQEISGITLE